MNLNRNNYNFIIYVDGLGFLISNEGKTPFFTEFVNDAMTFKKKDAEKLAITLCEDFKSVHILKKSGEVQSSEFIE